MHMLGSARVTFIMHTADTCFHSFHVNYWCEIVLIKLLHELYPMCGAVRKSLFFQKNVFMTFTLFWNNA